MVFFLFRHLQTGRNGQNKKKNKDHCTGLIRWRDWLNPPADWLNPPALPCPVYAVANVQFMLYSVQMSLYSVQMSLYSVQMSLYSVQITLYSVIQCDAKYTNCIIYILSILYSEKCLL